METAAFVIAARAPSAALETSLVEWKRGSTPQPRRMKPALETSLVEWKHLDNPETFNEVLALETSLVEWKHVGERFFQVPPCAPWKLP